jgi:triphosphatase
MTDEMKPMEIELKLVLPGMEAEEALVACLRENDYRVEELDPVRNIDTYLDTFDWSLFKNKLSLRYRVANGSALYTLKSVGSIEEGIAKRMETEVKLDGPVDIPAAVSVKKIRKLVDGVIFPRKLIEHIRVITDRRLYRVVSPEGAEIELAFDTSSFSLPGLQKSRRAQKLNELEAEILKGPAAALEGMAVLLAEKFHFLPSGGSKLEAAIERLKVILPSKKPPLKLRVGLEDRLDLAVRKFLTHQHQRFLEHLPGVHRDIDTEFVHQARVATRRMRSALRLFHDAVPENTAGYLERELKWLGGMFGAVRDLDVFLLNLVRFKEQIERFPAKKKGSFDNWIEKHRRAPFKTLCQALESPRYKSFERRLTQFLERPLPLRPRSPLALKTVREVTPLLVTERFEAGIKQGQTVLENPKLKQFHRLRIQMKKLRYASEFMAPAYDDRLDPFIERMVEIQDCLGEIQDTVFTRSFIDSLRDDWKGKLVDPELLFILGEIYQLQAHIEEDRKERFGKVWEQFSSEETMALLREILFGKSTPEPPKPGE